MKSRAAFRIGVILLFVGAFSLTAISHSEGSSHTSFPILGWMWGGSTDESIGTNPPGCGAFGSPCDPHIHNATGLGWISATSDNQSSGISYGINLPDPGGLATGYAWSSTVGWIEIAPAPDFGRYPACGYPTIPCSGVRRVGDELEGWARIVSIAQALAQGNSGGWEGWIRMKGIANNAQSSPYGVTLIPIPINQNPPHTHALVGYAWSDNLGWVYFGTGPDNPPFVTTNLGAPSIPTVSVAVIDGLAAEPGTDRGTFELTRTGSTANSLAVTVTFTGQAISGTDYKPITVPITIPQNQNSVLVEVVPRDDILPESLEDVIVTVENNLPTYTAGLLKTGSLSIFDNDVLPSCGVTIIPNGGPSNTAATITWSPSNATSCVASGDWSGNKIPSGGSEQVIVSGTGIKTYNLQCTNSLGTGAPCTTIFTIGSASPITCAPKIQAVPLGKPATFAAQGTLPFQWSAPNGTPTAGLGTPFTTSFQTLGSHSVVVSNGVAQDTCVVKTYRLSEEIPEL